jgi:mono/diheme cytochrome c family protein/glucose/arabinose dehydrogenase
MRRLHAVAGALAVLLLGAVALAAIIGPERLLDRAGYTAAESRLVTGLAVGGTAASPVVFVTSSDPRLPYYVERERFPIDTNSGVVSMLSRSDDGWERRDLVQGLPRSDRDHASNGIVFDAARERLYVAQGSMTNMGAPSSFFDTPEYALSAAILSIELASLGDEPYALPTLDDETRSGRDDEGDPFGGNGGRNQAIAEVQGPVRLHATGFRNPYDLVLTRKGALIATDNGPNWHWGAPPRVVSGRCTNRQNEGGRYVSDTVILVEEGGYYGHPNPTRTSRRNTFNASNPQSPIVRPRPDECRYARGRRGVLATFGTSTNGLAEYTAANFDGAMAGDLVVVSFDRRIHRIDLDRSGRRAVDTAPLAEVVGDPLDLTTQQDADPFPGTIWVADWTSGDLIVLEPRDRRAGAHWERLAPSAIARQEVAWVRVGESFYLAGGDRRHEVYDPANDSWRDVSALPERLEHIQGVAVGGLIYYIGGLRAYPEPAVGSVLIYDPASDSFSRGAPMPRPRGAGGVAVYDGKIYYAGGLSDGRAVAWFDVYDPATDSWSALPDMPRPRDHFQGQVAGSRFYAIGGRDSDVDANIDANDAYELVRGRWISGLAPLPTPRGGYASALVGDEIVVFGGEASDRVYAEVEAYDTRTDTWRALEPMPVPRHGIQAIVCAGDVFIAAGGEEPFGDAPSSVNSLYATRADARCPLMRGQAVGSARIGFRVVRTPTGLTNPTSLQFGPDGKLYVSEQDGTVAVLTVHRTDEGRYEVVTLERIEAIRAITNHDDDGSPAASWSTFARLVAIRTGICCSYAQGAPEPAPNVPTEPGDPERGRALFHLTGCGGCHAFTPAGTSSLAGPPLDARSNLPATYLEQAIVDPDAFSVPGYPPGQMPPDYAVSLSRQQLADIVAFVRRQPRTP